MFDVDFKDIIKQGYVEKLKLKDKEFFKRVFEGGIEKYEKRIKKLGFVGKETSVLDVGCGFGQWSLAFAKYNASVCGIEYQMDRFNAFSKIINDYKINNIEVVLGDIEDTRLYQNFQKFDYVFCYGVIFLTNWRKTLKNLINVTKKGGYIYICANDVGWYYHLIKEEPNKVSGYNPMEHGISAFVNEYRYEKLGEEFSGDRILRLQTLLDELKRHRECSLAVYSYEGGISKEDAKYVMGVDMSFFKGEYCGLRGVYEVIIQKNK